MEPPKLYERGMPFLQLSSTFLVDTVIEDSGKAAPRSTRSIDLEPSMCLEIGTAAGRTYGPASVHSWDISSRILMGYARSASRQSDLGAQHREQTSFASNMVCWGTEREYGWVERSRRRAGIR